MTTYLFITHPDQTPEDVSHRKQISWSCSKDTRVGDRILVYVTGIGVICEWRATSDAVPDSQWKYACDVEHLCTFKSPVSLPEIISKIPMKEWAPPHLHFRSYKSLKVPSNVARKLYALAHIAFPSRTGVRNDLQSLEREFAKAVAASQKLTRAQRQKRIASAPKKPRKIEVTTTVFVRNSDVVAEVLSLANGICQGCNSPAPFKRRKDNKPYLEVHHVKRLSSGGSDTVENSVALCPNCHRQAHFGQPS